MAGTTTQLTRQQNKVTQYQSSQPVLSDDPDQLQSQIRRTRAQMEGTIDEIQARLAPEHLKEQAQEKLREATIGKVETMAHQAERSVQSWRANAMDTVRENPIPAAMIGIGLGWLLLSRRNGRDDYNYQERDYRYATDPYQPYYGYQPYEEQGRMEEMRDQAAHTMQEAKAWAGEKVEAVGDTAENLQNRAAETAQNVKASVGEAVHKAEDYASQVSSQASEAAHRAQLQAQQSARQLQYQARRQVRRARYTFEETMEETPLIVGVAALALGALVGLALPGTAKENEWMGETRDRLVDDVKATAQETARKVQNVAEQAQHAAVSEAKREAQKQDLTMPTASTKPTTEPVTQASTRPLP
jgi:ElaB/YqjD/DUF883 family membrane-anchored ribosome-binding protein